MNGVAEDFVALVAEADSVDLAGLETDRGGAGDTLQGLGVLEALGAAADLSQQTRGQRLARAGQRAKQVMIGMLLEERLDLLAILVQLELQGLEQPGQADGQEALGRGHRRRTAKLPGVLEDFQPFGRRFRPPELLGVEELFPAPPARRRQFFRRGKPEEEVPAKGLRPIVESLEGCRIVLTQGLLELIDQGRALFDQRDLVTAQQLDLLG